MRNKKPSAEGQLDPDGVDVERRGVRRHHFAFYALVIFEHPFRPLPRLEAQDVGEVGPDFGQEQGLIFPMERGDVMILVFPAQPPELSGFPGLAQIPPLPPPRDADRDARREPLIPPDEPIHQLLEEIHGQDEDEKGAEAKEK